MDSKIGIFDTVETEREYDGYFYSVGEMLRVVILGRLCGLKNLKQIHQWATNDRVSEFLKEEFGISRLPCYYWFLCILKLVKPASLNACFVKWVQTMLPADMQGKTVAIAGGADYLLSVKDNQPALKGDIEDYVQDEELRQAMTTATTQEQSRDLETRTAYVTNDISWLPDAESWEHITTLGAIHTQCRAADKTKSDWHYYISSKDLTADELLHYARTEWTVETMHWMLDVHFSEDFCRVEDKNTQQNLNIIRKIALNILKSYKQATASKRPLSNIMFDCLLDCHHLLEVFSIQT